jgi:hypothetical protein
MRATRIGNFWSSLRGGSWLSPARLRRIALVLAVVYAATWVYALSGPGHLDPAGRPVGSDFSFFYGVSHAVRNGARVASFHDAETFHRALAPFTAGGRYLWFYPPTAVLLFWPLSLLPYLAALGAWLAAGLAGFAVVGRAILPGRAAMAGLLVYPGVFAASIHGQCSLVVAALVGGGFVLLPRAPVVAGLLFGAATLKPQFVLLLPVALLAGRRWRAIAGAVAGALGLAILAGALLGMDSWVAFLGAGRAAGLLLERQGVPYFKLGSVFAAVRLAGGGSVAGWILQGAVAGAALAWVAALWRRRAACLDTSIAGTLVATYLATPYFYDYDLVLLGLGLAFWFRSAARSGWRPWEKSVLFALWALPLYARPFAQWTRVSLAPLLLLAAAALIEARSRMEPAGHHGATASTGSARPGPTERPPEAASAA